MSRHRTQELLAAVAKDYPSLWTRLDEMLDAVRADGVSWPAWCWAPVAAAYALVSGGGNNRVPPARALDVGRVAGLYAWRPTQRIYRVDDALLEQLWTSELDGALPVDTLLHLPEWCVYVETPGRLWESDMPMHGFFAHLECDANSHDIELRFLVDTDMGLLPVPVPLGHGEGTIADSWRVLMGSALSRIDLANDPVSAAALRSAAQLSASHLEGLLRPLISVVLYLCTSGEVRPHHPPPTKTRHGPRHFPPAKPELHDLGERIGAQLRAAALRAAEDGEGQGGRVTPHVRRAHWHTYVMGPRAGVRRREVRWLPPIFVRLGEDVTPVVRLVNDRESLS